MLQIQLFVDGQEVELYKDESITLTQSIQDILDIEKVFTDYSKTFNVPASKTNNKIFKHFYNYYIEGFDARTTSSAELHLNYKPFKKGRIKLEGAQLKNNEAQSYKLTFFGNTVTLKDKFTEEKLSSLEQLDKLSFDYTDANIEAYMADGLDGIIGGEDIADAIVFPLITHTERLIYDSGDTTAGTNNVHYTLLDTAAHGVKFNQLKPAVRIYSIIKAIELKYNITFSEDFFNQTNLPFFNLYMWLHTKQGGLFTDADAEYLIEGFSDVTGDIRDIGGVRTDHFENTYNEDKNQRTLVIKTVPSTSSEYSIIVKKDGEEFKKFSGLTGTTYNGESQDPEPFEIPKGKYSFYIQTDAAMTFDAQVIVENEPNSWVKSKKEISFNGTASVGSGDRVTITQHVPEMKIIDFITGLWKMFNLTSFVNDDGVIVVQPLNDFYSNNPKTYDITEHIDKTESVVDSVIPFSEVRMGYEGTDTFLAKNHLSLAKKEWGELYYKLVEEKGDVYEFELPFEHMKFEHLLDAQDSSKSNIMFGWSVDTSQEPTIGKPLLFYVARPIATVAAVNIAGQRKNISAPYIPTNSSLIGRNYGLSTAGQSLNFHSEFDEYDGHPNEKTLFKTFYEDYIKDLFDVRKRLTFLSAYLPLKITEQLTLADKLIVFDKLYRINKMTTNFETNKTEFELTNVLDEQIYQSNAFTIDIDITNDLLTADITNILASMTPVTADGFTHPPESNPVPEIIPGNVISNDTSTPCSVTAATIETNTTDTFSGTVEFAATIISKGLLCGQPNVDEYGFLIASTESHLTGSDDIDTLKADSNITVFSVQRNIDANEASLTNGIKRTVVTGLTDPETRFARFYVRTNIQDIFEKADVISSVIQKSSTADVANSDTATGFSAASAGHHNSGYSSIPTLAEIDAKRQRTNAAGRCGEEVFLIEAFHNGTGVLPVVGDKVKSRRDADYSGGHNSNPGYFGSIFSTNIYAAWGIAQNANGTLRHSTGENNFYDAKIEKYIVFLVSTAEVVAVYDCPVIGESYNYGRLYSSPGYPFHSVGFTQTVGTLRCGMEQRIINLDEFEHNGAGLNPVTNDKIKLKDTPTITYTYAGMSNSFTPQYLQASYIVLLLYGGTGSTSTRLPMKYVVTVRTTDATVVEYYECT